MNSLLPLFLLVLIFAAFYFMVIRPAKMRQNQALAVQTSLTPGDDVMTTAGIYGLITEVHDTYVLLQIAPGVEVRYAKAAIAEKISQPHGSPDTQVSSDPVSNREEDGR